MTQEIYSYNTLKVPAEGKYSEKGSKFLATVFPAGSNDEISDRLTEVKSKHPKARHVCYAYRLVENGHPVEYATDAGEPAGSAGLPILNALRSLEVFNVLGVVVRYYGGTKLGIPGLIHAYRESTVSALEQGVLLNCQRTIHYTLSMPMRLQPHIIAASKRLGMDSSDYTYSDRFSINIELPLRTADKDLQKLLRLVSKRDLESIDAYLEYLDIKLEGVSESMQ